MQEIATNYKTPEDFTKYFKQCKERGLETALSDELTTDHLGYESHTKAEERKTKARNGYSKKSVQINESEMK